MQKIVYYKKIYKDSAALEASDKLNQCLFTINPIKKISNFDNLQDS